MVDALQHIRTMSNSQQMCRYSHQQDPAAKLCLTMEQFSKLWPSQQIAWQREDWSLQQNPAAPQQQNLYRYTLDPVR